MNLFDQNGLFPDDLIVYVLSFVNDSQTICNCALLVNKRWNNAITNCVAAFKTSMQAHQRISNNRRRLKFAMTCAQLHERVRERPFMESLVSRNIIKNVRIYAFSTKSCVANELKFALLQTKLKHFLVSKQSNQSTNYKPATTAFSNRYSMSDLKKAGIIKNRYYSLQFKLHKCKVHHLLQIRPTKVHLETKGILKQYGASKCNQLKDIQSQNYFLQTENIETNGLEFVHMFETMRKHVEKGQNGLKKMLQDEKAMESFEMAKNGINNQCDALIRMVETLRQHKLQQVRFYLHNFIFCLIVFLIVHFLTKRVYM